MRVTSAPMVNIQCTHASDERVARSVVCRGVRREGLLRTSVLRVKVLDGL